MGKRRIDVDKYNIQRRLFEDLGSMEEDLFKKLRMKWVTEPKEFPKVNGGRISMVSTPGLKDAPIHPNCKSTATVEVEDKSCDYVGYVERMLDNIKVIG